MANQPLENKPLFWGLVSFGVVFSFMLGDILNVVGIPAWEGLRDLLCLVGLAWGVAFTYAKIVGRV